MNRYLAALLALALMPAIAWADDLTAYRQAAYARMAEARVAEMAAGFEFEGMRYPTDDHSRLLMFGAGQIAHSEHEEIDWKVSNGHFVTLKVGTVWRAWHAMTLWIEQLFTREKERDAAIDVCADSACIGAVKW